jgi:hypothetical protein
MRRWCAAVLVCAASYASAGTAKLDNGVVGVGHVDITTDDFGSYGRFQSPQDSDQFFAPGYQRADPMTTASLAMFFVYWNGKRYGAAMTSHDQFIKLLEGNGGDGLQTDTGTMTLSRTVVSPIVLDVNGVTHSQFSLIDSAAQPMPRIDVKLDQRLVPGVNPVSVFEQDYAIKNTSTTETIVLVFHELWDMNIFYSDMASETDIVGVGPGLCYLYMHDPGAPKQGGALSDGGSTVPWSAYYGAKEGVLPEDMYQPPFSCIQSGVATQAPWINYKMPPTWVNQVAKVGKLKAGETNVTANGAIAVEYQFTLTPQQTAVIRIRKHYGTTTLPCAVVGVNCGNNAVDAGEACDSTVDTATCNAGLCTAPMCGDGHVNTAAGETCESNGVDAVDCNGMMCTAPACGDGYLNTAAGEACDDGVDSPTCNVENCQPPVCGDGIINDAAGEECDGNELCDACKVTFSLGGGCAGCASHGNGGSLLLSVCVALWLRRRRRA